jgi:hypothetical protein
MKIACEMWFKIIPMLFMMLVPISETRADDPNIILIFIDDLGWKDVGCYGNDFIDTPNIDRLASEGMRFTDFYASGAVCSPTRCAVQSGQNQARIGITAHIPGHWRPFERVITPLTTMALPFGYCHGCGVDESVRLLNGICWKVAFGSGSAVPTETSGV